MPKTSDTAAVPRIVVQDVHKNFTLRHTHSMKETAIAALRRKPLSTQFRALDGVDIEIGTGESVALLGFNGSGKSTMLKLISGVLLPDEGQVLTRGRVAGLIEVGAGFHPDLSGRENVYLNAAILGMSRAETDARFGEIVAFSEIEQFIDTEVKHYSSGMFLRLAFAVAIHTEVDVLLIDEILAVGDEPFQRKCLARIRELHAQGKTLVVVSHDLGMVSRLCSRGIVLQGGKVVFDGDSTEAVRALRALSQSPFSDIERSHPYFDEITEMVNDLILPPYPDSSGRSQFRPDESVSSGNVALALRASATNGGLGHGQDGDEGAADSREASAVAWLDDTLTDLHVGAIDDVVTRADFASYLYALAGRPTIADTMPFDDVDATHPLARAINWLFYADVSRGWEDPLGPPAFRPTAPMTRESLVIMIARYRGIRGGLSS